MAGKILLVEDTDDYREKLSKTLKTAGYEVLCACNGQEGINLLLKEGSEIALIVSDLHMPELNGLEMAKKIFEEEITKVPIMMLTTDTSKEMRRLGMEAGVKHWFIKPVPTSVFLAGVGLIMKKFGHGQPA